jgi:hypothetical protein
MSPRPHARRPAAAAPLVLLALGAGPSAAGCRCGGAASDAAADAGAPADAAAPSDAAASDAGAPTLTVSDHGVTWTFAAPVENGRFITGDPWILCPATVVAIDPAPTPGRNGTVLNLPPVDDASGWDDRVEANRFDATLRSDPPIDLVAGDILLSSVSIGTPGLVDNWLREGKGEASLSPVMSISVLTCLDAPPPADAFRPSYASGGDPTARIYTMSDVDTSILPALAPTAPVDPFFLQDFADRYGRPWVDNLFFGFDAAVDYMPMYGREHARAAGMASLLLMLDLPPAEDAAQAQLLVGFVQHGIDLWGLVRAGYPGWEAFGGHGSGRKWPIVLAGLLLGDPEMASPSVTYPAAWFGEDMHTAFVADLLPPNDVPTWWDSSDVVYTGHRGVWAGAPVDPGGWGPYEHLAPEAWLDSIGEDYRRCCTSIAWVGEALAAHLVAAEPAWAHDAFFAYVDRWMDPTGDAAYTAEILTRTGLDYGAAWQAHGQTWDTFVQDLWTAYR